MILTSPAPHLTDSAARRPTHAANNAKSAKVRPEEPDKETSRAVSSVPHTNRTVAAATPCASAGTLSSLQRTVIGPYPSIPSTTVQPAKPTHVSTACRTDCTRVATAEPGTSPRPHTSDTTPAWTGLTAPTSRARLTAARIASAVSGDGGHEESSSSNSSSESPGLRRSSDRKSGVGVGKPSLAA